MILQEVFWIEAGVEGAVMVDDDQGIVAISIQKVRVADCSVFIADKPIEGGDLTLHNYIDSGDVRRLKQCVAFFASASRNRCLCRFPSSLRVILRTALLRLPTDQTGQRANSKPALCFHLSIRLFGSHGWHAAL